MTENSVNRLLKKLFLFMIKYIPIMQMVGMLINNTLYYFDINTNTYYITNFITGNSIVTTILLYICSYLFKFCNWYRLIITANMINMFIGIIDVLFTIPITDFQLLVLYYTISVLFIFIIIIKKFKCNERKSSQTTK